MPIKYYWIYNESTIIPLYIDSESKRIISITDDYITINEQNVDCNMVMQSNEVTYALKFDVAKTMLSDMLCDKMSELQDKINNIHNLKEL